MLARRGAHGLHSRARCRAATADVAVIFRRSRDFRCGAAAMPIFVTAGAPYEYFCHSFAICCRCRHYAVAYSQQLCHALAPSAAASAGIQAGFSSLFEPPLSHAAYAILTFYASRCRATISRAMPFFAAAFRRFRCFRECRRSADFSLLMFQISPPLRRLRH